MPGLAQGDYWLLANHPHLVPSELRAVTVRKGEAAEIPDLILDPGGAVSGQLLEGDLARSIAVTNRQTLEIDLDYQQGGRLFGSVWSLPAASSHKISLTPAEQPVRFPRTEAYLRPDSSFEIRGIETGRYLVEVNSAYRRPGGLPDASCCISHSEDQNDGVVTVWYWGR